MQRRQLLKWLLPLALLPIGVVAGRNLLIKASCHAADIASLLARLKPFSDIELGKKIHAGVTDDELRRFDPLCEADFDRRYRQWVMDDFAQGKTTNVDGWILSETEALTHRAAYYHQGFLSGAQPDAGSKP